MLWLLRCVWSSSEGSVALCSGRSRAVTLTDKGFMLCSAGSPRPACQGLCSVILLIPAGLVVQGAVQLRGRRGVHPAAEGWHSGGVPRSQCRGMWRAVESDGFSGTGQLLRAGSLPGGRQGGTPELYREPLPCLGSGIQRQVGCEVCAHAGG